MTVPRAWWPDRPQSEVTPMEVMPGVPRCRAAPALFQACSLRASAKGLTTQVGAPRLQGWSRSFGGVGYAKASAVTSSGISRFEGSSSLNNTLARAIMFPSGMSP